MGETMSQRTDQKDELSEVVARVKTDALAVVFAILGGLGLWAMTVWLLIKGGPHTGEHLQLLSNYFVGYSVTWTGSLLGLLYGALTGGLIGWLVGRIYNQVVKLRRR
jgi:hypothetical protein